MYDPQTAELIRGAPPLEGLDLDALPEGMTRAFARIVAMRVLLRGHVAEPDKEFEEIVNQLRGLANTYEAYVSLITDLKNRESAAFVSATAHRLLSQVEALTNNSEPSTVLLSRDFVSSRVTAMLLFLIAGYPSDAQDLAKQLVVDDSGSIVDELLIALVALAEGTPARILTREVPALQGSEDLAGDATDVLWRRLLFGVRTLAEIFVGEIDSLAEQATPDVVFRSVQSDAVDSIDIGVVNESSNGRAAFTTFAGPNHLAALLREAGETLQARAAINIAPPAGLADDAWYEFLRSFCSERPYLWENHIAAIKGGYLEPGVSAAISFPTGAGKSTIAFLKVASAQLAGKPVLYLAPTHALIGQITRDLSKAFPGAKVRNSVISEGYYAEVESVDLPDIAVMTPERGLTQIGLSPEHFAKVGLIVFDECHLLHPSKHTSDRRALDAMLCLLHAIQAAAAADVLLMSAMMANAGEMAQWLEEVTGRHAVALELGWKPTRQARGCIMFSSTEVDELEKILDKAREKALRERAKKKKKKKKVSKSFKPGKKIRERIAAMPYALFSLRQTWVTTASIDYKLLQVLDLPVPLEVRANTWTLTPNRNAVAAAIAQRLAGLMMKTLVFTQNRIHAQALARQTATELTKDQHAVELTSKELDVLRIAIEEVGASEYTFQPFGGLAACHHGLLLPAERRLNEMLFQRRDGIHLLVATPTLAQGMNLPAEAVIIAGDDRYDPSTGHADQLEPHELLNAAGRAGRAGHVAQGLVLIIPGQVVEFNAKEGKLAPKWFELQRRVFSKTDQCLAIQDPVEALLDHIHLTRNVDEAGVRYFLNRLPEEDGSGDGARKFLDRSMAAFHAREQKREKEFQQRVDEALQLRKSIVEPKTAPWIGALATTTGLPTETITAVDQALHKQSGAPYEGGVDDWVDWFFGWLEEDPPRIVTFVKWENLKKIYDPIVAKRKRMPESLKITLETIKVATHGWMTGASLVDLEKVFETPQTKLNHCANARRFVLRVIPELSYGIGVVAQVHRKHLEALGEMQMPIALATAAACVREGHDIPEKLAIRYIFDRLTSRRRCNEMYLSISESMKPHGPTEDFTHLRKRVARALH